MIFLYGELKDSIRDDFNTFYIQMKFKPTQIIPAILNEYEHGDGFAITEETCIYLFLLELYTEYSLDTDYIYSKLSALLNESNVEMIKQELLSEFDEFLEDVNNFKLIK